MHYIVVENNQIMGIMPYEPAVPESAQVITITDEQYSDIFTSKTHFFDPAALEVKLKPQEQFSKEQQDEAARIQNIEKKEFLNSTDWKVMRHIREKALGQSTSLTDQEYLDLEQARATAAAAIIEIQ
jgi:hypothetical protein